VIAAVVALLLVTAACAGAPPSATPEVPGSEPGSEQAAVAGTTMATPPGLVVPTIAAPETTASAGTLIDATPIPSSVAGTHAWRISYHSTDAAGHDIAVSGVLLAPDHPAPGAPVITWGHPTTGTADECAPSLQGTAALPFPEQVAARGWTMVASDYQGLDSPGPHPYLVGPSEGHTVLDAVRAARHVDGSPVTARSPVTIWGFSQGGHAAAFAAQLAPTYATDIDLRGVAVAAPVSSVTSFAKRAEQRSDQLGVLVTIVGTYPVAYPDLDPATVLTPEAVSQLGELERRCIGDVNIFFDRPIPTVVAHPATSQQPWASRFEENEAGRQPSPVPALVVQGAKDDIVDPADTAAFVQRWCDQHVAVDSVIVPDANHGVLSEQPFLDWIAGRFDGDPAPSTC
jgi:dipeptidyl aminopeptidase/acylaminoacyl peptidase